MHINSKYIKIFNIAIALNQMNLILKVSCVENNVYSNVHSVY